MSSKRNVNILADQHHSHTLPPYHQPPPQSQSQSHYSSGPPVLSPVTAPASHQHQQQHHHHPHPHPHSQHQHSQHQHPHPHPPQTLPALSSLSHPPRYQGPPPPPLHTASAPSSHSDSQDKTDHGYSGPHSGHATPIIRNHPDGPVPAPYQRNTSTPIPAPAQPLPPPPLDRPPMENGHSSQALYAAHPPPPPQPQHPDQHHMMYPPPAHSGPPIMDHGPYTPHPVYHPQGYLYPNMHLANQNTRKKSMRASQACDKCRERKSKCDEQRPCSTCKEQNIECHYKDSQPSKVDKSNAQLADTMQTMVDQLKVLTDRIHHLEDSMGRTGPTSMKSEVMSRQSSRNDTPAPSTDREQQRARAVAELRRPSVADNYDFAEHTTAAHKLLLRWPSIHRLLPNNKHPDNYPLIAEDRGVMRLYGRGEQRSREENIAIGAESPAQSLGSDDMGNAPSPEIFHVFGLDEPKRSDPGIASRLEMEKTTLERLYKKYKQHIHRLHPFLDIDNFGKYITKFIKLYCTENRCSFSPGFVPNGSADSQGPAAKRRRLDMHAPSFSGSENSSKRRIQPERTVINAIVYLVFALGKVCESVHIPGPLEEEKPDSIEQAQPGASPLNVKPSPSSPYTAHIGYTPPTGADSFRTESRGSSFEDSPGLVKRSTTNIDIVPGLDYYREAVSILGDFADANDLPSAQARLLAALYKGQLSRVQESYSWLHLASRTCQYRIRLEGLNHTYNPTKVFDKTKNLTLLAYWTCLQLESDILAELDYPHSGLSAMEGTVNWPNNVLDEEASRSIVSDTATDLDMINIYYSAQLFLRKHLNQIHTRIYSVDLAKQDPKILSETLDDLDNTLQGWRDLPHPITFWNDKQPPHPDILAARLRAKYYGARYVTTRPFLDYALHVMEEVKKGRKLEDVTKNAMGVVRKQELVLFKAIQMMDEETIKGKVKICIDSALKSTVALDFVSDHRLIVTNIMGTAHAQFGNVLVLAAAYTSGVDWLSGLVSRRALGHYIERTIKFLKKIEDSSRTACVDMEILQELQANLGFSKDDYSPNASYTS